ncbi:PREDICTED: proteasome activator complex subunit 4-like [Priapulus caudatus]|uniref:Proteasome activator complex subunit 4-like n=1 Tax=Priapulus caudatus TaxID=37621 RepID=A0ABM1E7N7_PRICU|nr:PREDICTED: proteasome activator complex subunit 4-like [Priapulus caudatus]
MAVDNGLKQASSNMFKTQKNSIYNELLPYAEDIKEEAEIHLSLIKENIGRSVLMKELRPGVLFWTAKLNKYITLYGFKFSKEDHLAFINLFFNLVTAEDMEMALVAKFSLMLTTLVKKKELLSRDDLVLPWRPLYELYNEITYGGNEQIGLVLLPTNIDGAVKNLIKACRVYFPAEATREMVAEWRPLMCPFDTTMSKAMQCFELFLPTILPPELHEHGFKVWFDELMTMWEACHNVPSWEVHLINLFARTAKDNIGYIDWQPYISMIFTRMIRSFNLPVGSRQIQVGRTNCSFDIGATAMWIAAMMGGGQPTVSYIHKMFQAMESYFHPSNTGRWILKLQRLMAKLTAGLVRRLNEERHQKRSWVPAIPAGHCLGEAEITEFVEAVKPVVMLSMFSKAGSGDCAGSLQNLSTVRPELVIPPLLEQLYPSLTTLTEPHRLVSTMNCVVAVSRSMLRTQERYSEGRHHFLPLLMLCLPGIDSNDIKKSMVTFQLISTFVTLVPLVDCSSAVQNRSDLSEEEKELCSATAGFEDFVLLFMDRCFELVRNSSVVAGSQHHTANAHDKMNAEESMLEVGISSTISAVLTQCSREIYDAAVQMLFNFVCNNVFEVAVAGKFVANMCRAATKSNPQVALKLFVPHFHKVIVQLTSGEDLKEEAADTELLWTLQLLCEDWCIEGDVDNLNISWHIPSVEEKQFAQEILDTFMQPAIARLNSVSDDTNLSRIELQEDLNLVLECLHGAGAMLPLLDGEPIYLAVLSYQGVQRDDFDTRWKSFHIVKKAMENKLMGNKRHIRALLIDRVVLQHERRIMDKSKFQFTDLHQRSLEDLFLLSTSRYSQVRARAQAVMSTVMHDFPHCYTRILPRTLALLKEDPDISHEQLKGALYILRGNVKSTCLATKHDWKVLSQVWPAIIEAQHSEKLSIIDMLDLLVDRISKNIDTLSLTVTVPDAVLQAAEKMWAHQPMPEQQTPEAAELTQAEARLQERNTENLKIYKTMIDKNVELLNDGKLRWRHYQVAVSFLTQLLREDERLPMHAVRVLVNNLNHDSLIVRKLCTSAMGAVLKQQKRTREKKEVDVTTGHFVATECPRESLMGTKPSQIATPACTPVPASTDCATPAETSESVATLGCPGSPPTPDAISDALTAAAEKGSKMAAGDRGSKMATAESESKMGASEEDTLPPLSQPNNDWLLLDMKDVPNTADSWRRCVMIDKTHLGYYCWPKPLMAHALNPERPPGARKRDDLDEEEIPLFDAMSDPVFIEKLVGFMSLEDRKGKDKFDARKYTFLKGIFRNYESALLGVLRPHIEKLAVDPHESSQRFSAECIAALMRGSKHWSWEQLDEMYSWLVPLLRLVIKNMTVETISDWGSCIATASESLDPKRLHWLFKVLMENPFHREADGSFMVTSHLYLLQAAIGQQEWKVKHLLSAMLEMIVPQLGNSYKNIRDRLGSTLGSVFLFEMELPHLTQTYCPSRAQFITSLMPQLQVLVSQQSTSPTTEVARDAEGDTSMCEVNEEERSKAVRVFETTLRWLQTSLARMHYSAPPEVFQLLPLVCQLENESTDEELKKECMLTLACLAQALLKPDVIPYVLKVIQQIMNGQSWRSKQSVLEYLQVMVFCNLFAVMQSRELVGCIHDIVLNMMTNEQLEVREMASVTLGGFLHCELFTMDADLLDKFRSWANTRIRRRGGRVALDQAGALVRRHAGVLGLCAYIEAHPYDVTALMPDVLMMLSNHVNDPQPIQVTARKALSNFRRTHYDNWQDHKLMFTDDQLAILTDLLVSPSYYA